MDYLDILKFACSSALSSPLNFIFAAVAAAGGFLVVTVAKNLINTKWPGGKTLAGIAAAVSAACTFTYLGMNNADAYIMSEKASLSSKLRDDVVWRNEALSRTWENIATEDSQAGVTPIIEGGTMMKISSKADAQIYAQEAAQVLEEHLRLKSSMPSNVSFQSKEDVAITVMAANQNEELANASPERPYELYQDNGIASQVLELRIDELFEAVSEGVDSEKQHAMDSMVLVLISVLLLMSVIVGIGGWRDLLSTK